MVVESMSSVLGFSRNLVLRLWETWSAELNQPDKDPSKTRIWSHISGLLLVWSSILAFELLSCTPLAIPNPPAVLVMVVVFSAFTGGLHSSLISAAVACLYIACYHSVPGHPFEYTGEDLGLVRVWAATMPATALMVGVLRRRAERI